MHSSGYVSYSTRDFLSRHFLSGACFVVTPVQEVVGRWFEARQAQVVRFSSWGTVVQRIRVFPDCTKGAVMCTFKAIESIKILFMFYLLLLHYCVQNHEKNNLNL